MQLPHARPTMYCTPPSIYMVHTYSVYTFCACTNFSRYQYMCSIYKDLGLIVHTMCRYCEIILLQATRSQSIWRVPHLHTNKYIPLVSCDPSLCAYQCYAPLQYAMGIVCDLATPLSASVSCSEINAQARFCT